jgi:glycosyltransferase involved in cell wall biosynthesis
MPDGRPWPWVTVVTPSFNQERYIEETLRSVLLQGYPALEHVVIDGGSTDGSVDIVRRYGDWLARWVSEPDDGQSDALNKGFAGSRGEVMAWLNSDDLYLPGAIRRAVETLATRPRAGLVYGTCHILDSADLLVRPASPRPFRRADILRGALTIPQPSAFWTRSAWERVGPIRRDYHYCMDLDLWMSIAEQFDVIYVPEVWACFREHEASKTGGGRRPFEDEEVLVRRAHHRRRRLLRLAMARPAAYFTPSMLAFMGARMLPRSWTRRINRARSLPPMPD